MRAEEREWARANNLSKVRSDKVSKISKVSMRRGKSVNNNISTQTQERTPVGTRIRLDLEACKLEVGVKEPILARQTPYTIAHPGLVLQLPLITAESSEYPSSFDTHP